MLTRPGTRERGLGIRDPGGRRVAASLHRLATAPAAPHDDGIDWHTPIDRSRWFFCETLTPLYYAPVYQELTTDQRRRYNQLSAMMANEVIGFMETEVVVPALSAIAAFPADAAMPADLHAAVVRFRDDEQQHAETWRKLNRLSDPERYAAGESSLLQVPSGARAAARLIARHPVALPVVFWMQLVQEERSLEISRRCMRVPSPLIEPRYAAAYGAHLHDEARHVQIDRHLIDVFYRRRTTAMRRVTALLFRTIVGSLLVTPIRSAARVVRALAAEHPELRSLIPRLLDELRDMEHNREYHDMMYSRRTTPTTFALFDEFPEFHQVQAVFRSYEPRAAERRHTWR